MTDKHLIDICGKFSIFRQKKTVYEPDHRLDPTTVVLFSFLLYCYCLNFNPLNILLMWQN